MGSGSSVHASSSTFLTAYDHEENEEDEDEDEDEGCHSTEEQNFDDMISVATADFITPPNKFCKFTDFEAVKARHNEMKEKYVEYLHTYMSEAIPKSINRAKFISSLRLEARGGQQNEKYLIDPAIIAEMETRGSMQLAKAHKRDLLNSVNLDVAHKNKALSFRQGAASNRMHLPCATHMDEKPGEYLSSVEYYGAGSTKERTLGRSAAGIRLELKEELQARLPPSHEEEDNSSTMLEFRKHFEARQKKAITRERRKATWSKRYQDWKQMLREKYINYDYE